jgi:hypothetical protein
MNQFTVGDEHLAARLDVAAASVRLMLQVRASGAVWGPCPLAWLTIHDRMQRRTDLVRECRVKVVAAGDQRISLALVDEGRGIQVGLVLSVQRRELVVDLPWADLRETNGEIYRVGLIQLLPGLLAVHGADAHLLLPLNSGVLCRPAGKPACADRFLIYGEQSRWELLPLLPVTAATDARGGLVTLVTRGACDASCRVATDGRGGGEVGLDFSVRGQWFDPVDPSDRQTRFVPVPRDADLVAATAQRLRRHVMDDLGKPTLAQRAAESPDVAYALGAYTIKLFHGVQEQGLMLQQTPGATAAPQFICAMPFAEAADSLRRLRTAGLTRVLAHSVGWNPGGHDGLYPTRFPIEERLGGEAGFRALLAAGGELGFQVNVHDNQVMAVRASPEFDVNTVVWDEHGEAEITGCWGGGITYARWAQALSDEQILGPMRRLAALGLRGLYYLDGMGNPLYLNYHPCHAGPRAAYAASVNRFTALARSVFGAVGTEMGFLYCTVPVDYIVSHGAPWHLKLVRPEWPVAGLLDQRVPLWPLALHGLVMHENQGLDWPSTMECVLFGAHPRYEFSTRPGVMPVFGDPMVAALRARFDLCLGQLGHLQSVALRDHAFLADNVERTRFADGTEVVADFGNRELMVNGRLVPCPAALIDRAGVA